jgi:hypothetical protein
MDDDIVEVMVKVPVTVTVKAPRWLAEDSDEKDLREIVDSVIQRDFPVTIEWKSEPIACVVGPHWDNLPEEEMETMSTESGSWGE